MQAMARQQAATGSAATEDENYPFSTLAVWRDKLQADLAAPVTSKPSNKLSLLLEQGKDVEQAVLGCLKDSLYELQEGAEWGLLDPTFQRAQRAQLLHAAANELNTDKQLCVQLAREQGLLEQYAAELQRPIHRTLADYERVGELKFAMLVWRANLKRDASLVRSTAAAAGGSAGGGLPAGAVSGGGEGGSEAGAGSGHQGGGASDQLELELLFRTAYEDALRLVQRCGGRSLRFWAAQQAGGAPTQASLQKLYQAATQRVQNSLLEVAEGRLDPATLQALFRELPGPEAVRGEEPEAQEEEEELVGSEGERERRGVARGSSEESESSTLGM